VDRTRAFPRKINEQSEYYFWGPAILKYKNQDL
jgi:hypothetical protein